MQQKKMLEFKICFLTIFVQNAFFQEIPNTNPIHVIDIFTNFPDQETIAQEYALIKNERNNSDLSRNYHDDYDSDYRRYHNYYPPYNNRRYSDSDLLESEFGIFDKDNYEEKYVYLPENHYYSIKDQVDENQNYKNKLNKLIGLRPNFQTSNSNSNSNTNLNSNSNLNLNSNYQSDKDELSFDNKIVLQYNQYDASDVLDNENLESEYGEIVTKKRKIKKKRPQKITKPTNTTSSNSKLTNIMRKYLIRMHKNKSKRNKKKNNKDRTLMLIQNYAQGDRKHDFKVGESDENKGKFLTYPLEHIKNKTKLFANKFLSLFTVIQFANFKCQASNALSNYEGTCFLAGECAQMNGIAMGNCADGHGVCCVFKGSCGGVGTKNCTYFESPNYPNYFPGDVGVVPPAPETTTTQNPNTPDPRFQILYREGRQNVNTDNVNALSCIYKIYKIDDSVKQMRIDFIDLELKGPTAGTCVDERLIISGTGLNTMVPVLCGYNTGQHVYVDVSSLSGPLQIAVLANAIERKRYKIRICQYNDGCSGLMNCLQSYTGVTGTITSFNYEKAAAFSRSNPQYLNNLNYAICIKREAGYCSITYSVVGPNNVQYPFELKNYDDDGSLSVPNGQAGVGIINCPDDYLVINGIRLCGDRLNDGSVNEDFTRNAPVTDTSAGPIVIPVRTNNVQTGRGFKLFYMQNRCGTTGIGGNGGLLPDPRY